MAPQPQQQEVQPGEEHSKRAKATSHVRQFKKACADSKDGSSAAQERGLLPGCNASIAALLTDCDCERARFEQVTQGTAADLLCCSLRCLRVFSGKFVLLKELRERFWGKSLAAPTTQPEKSKMLVSWRTIFYWRRVVPRMILLLLLLFC
jgi:hypothetical protein